MKIKNPGCLTDAIFHQDHGVIEDRGDYYLIRTPSNPSFYWGNYLLFKSPPTKHSFEEWLEIHYREFNPEQNHIAFGWDSIEKGDTEVFEKNDFTLNDGVVLKLTSSPNPVFENSEIEVRPILEDWEWLSVIEAQVKEGSPDGSDEGYRDFKSRQMNNYRASQDHGRGHWWGAFLGDELVGDMGLFFSPDGKTGRFQSVETAPAHRRKGVCRTLLAQIARKAFEQEKAEELFIVTDADSVPEKIYQSVGFTSLCPQRGLWRVSPSPPVS